MTPDLKNSNALELITAYNIINVYTKTFEMQDFAFVTRQEAYYNFYLAWKDLDFDKLIIEISNSKAFMGLLNRLHSNVKKYIDTSNSINYNFQDVDIFEIITISKNRYYQHRLDLLNSEKQTISTYNYSTENERAVLLEENKVELLELKLEISTYVQNIHDWFSDDYHIKIYHLSNSFLKILNDYLSVRKQKETGSFKSINTKDTYFNSIIIHSVFCICNEKLFEKATENDYQDCFNNLQKSIVLNKITRKDIYFFYLIKFLSERIEINKRKFWIEEILKRFDISKQGVYDRKKNELENQIKSGNNKAIEFRDILEQIKLLDDQLSSLE